MPARTYDLFLTNESGFTLTKTFDHLCHGIFTPALAPPGSILSGQQMRWKSESDGFATGTEGYVKYRIEGTGDTVYIYWDNPFTLGVTHAKGQVSTADVEPDCDFEKTSGGSTFSPPSKFEISLTFQSQGPAPDTPEVVAEVPLAPFFVFANSGISEHALIALTLGRKPNNLKTFAARRGLDLSKGIRHLLPSAPIISLRAVMGV
jgi:hypothetical protein